MRKVTPANCSSVAFAKRLNLAAGKPICRPSVNSMKTVRFTTQARVATNSSSFGLKIIILLQEKGLVFENQALDSANVDCTHAPIFCQSWGRQPELAFAITSIDVNMRRLRAFIRVKMKPEPQKSENGWHARQYRACILEWKMWRRSSVRGSRDQLGGHHGPLRVGRDWQDVSERHRRLAAGRHQLQLDLQTRIETAAAAAQGAAECVRRQGLGLAVQWHQVVGRDPP